MIGIVAAFALAFGLAFGMGGRGVAEKVSNDWYEASRKTASKISRSMAEDDKA
ncbi:MAG: hypothetical protein ABI573_01650 [Chloroflexota bacterium]